MQPLVYKGLVSNIYVDKFHTFYPRQQDLYFMLKHKSRRLISLFVLSEFRLGSHCSVLLQL